MAVTSRRFKPKAPFVQRGPNIFSGSSSEFGAYCCCCIGCTQAYITYSIVS